MGKCFRDSLRMRSWRLFAGTEGGFSARQCLLVLAAQALNNSAKNEGWVKQGGFVTMEGSVGRVPSHVITYFVSIVMFYLLCNV